MRNVSFRAKVAVAIIASLVSLLVVSNVLQQQRTRETRISFGNGWGSVEQPVAAVISAIDPEKQLLVGLSAMQLDNLQLKRMWTIDADVLKLMRENNKAGIPDFSSYPPMKVSIGDKAATISVYNAFGHMATGASNGILISSELARRLGLNVGDTVSLSTQ